MTQWIDKRLEKATVSFKDQLINPTAINILAECLEMISEEFFNNSAVSLKPNKKKGKCNNGNIGKN